MLRSWNKVSEIGLFPDQLWIRQFQRLPRRPLQSGRWSALTLSPSEGVQEILKRKLEGMLGTEKVTFTFSNHWFQFGALSWALQSGNDEQDRLLALAQLEDASALNRATTSTLPSSALIALAPARFSRDRLFVVVHHELAMALRELERSNIALDQWQPWAFSAFARLQEQLPSSCLLAILEDGIATLLHCQDDWPEAVSTRRFQAGDTSSLSSMLRTETLRSRLPLFICPDVLPFQLPSTLSAEATVVGGLLAGLPPHRSPVAQAAEPNKEFTTT